MPLITTGLASCVLLQLNSLLCCKAKAIQDINFTIHVGAAIHIDGRREVVIRRINVVYFSWLFIRTVTVVMIYFFDGWDYIILSNPERCPRLRRSHLNSSRATGSAVFRESG